MTAPEHHLTRAVFMPDRQSARQQSLQLTVSSLHFPHPSRLPTYTTIGASQLHGRAMRAIHRRCLLSGHPCRSGVTMSKTNLYVDIRSTWRGKWVTFLWKTVRSCIHVVEESAPMTSDARCPNTMEHGFLVGDRTVFATLNDGPESQLSRLRRHFHEPQHGDRGCNPL